MPHSQTSQPGNVKKIQTHIFFGRKEREKERETEREREREPTLLAELSQQGIIERLGFSSGAFGFLLQPFQ